MVSIRTNAGDVVNYDISDDLAAIGDDVVLIRAQLELLGNQCAKLTSTNEQLASLQEDVDLRNAFVFNEFVIKRKQLLIEALENRLRRLSSL